MTWGPLTDTYGLNVTVASDGSGGLVLTTAKYGSLSVTATQLRNLETAELVRRLTSGEDIDTNWPNLVSHLAGNG